MALENKGAEIFCNYLGDVNHLNNVARLSEGLDYLSP